MKRVILSLAVLLPFHFSLAQEKQWEGKFEQLGTELPTPNEYRTGSGAPGNEYWQQQANYEIEVELNDNNQSITGKENSIIRIIAPK